MVDFKSVVKKWDYQKTVSKYKDATNFEIAKPGRFSARAFQIGLSVVSYYWISAQDQAFLAAHGLAQINGAIM